MWKPSLAITPRHVAICYALVASWVTIRLGVQALHGFAAFDWKRAGCCDAAVDWRAAQLALEGLSPFEPPGSTRIGVAHKGFGHPPTAPFWFLLFTDFTHPRLGFALAVLALGLLLSSVHWCVRELAFPCPLATTALLFVLLWRLPGVQLHLSVVQISIPIAACSVLAWVLLRRGQDALGGVALGVACTLKLFPGVLVMFLLLRGRLRAVVAAAATWGLVAGVMSWRFGWRAWPQFFEQQGPIAKNWIADAHNASLHGAIRRAFAETCGTPEATEQFLRVLTTATASTLLVATLVLVEWRRRRHAGAEEFDFSWSLVSVVATFCNPWIWSHYVAMLVLPVLFSVRRLGAFLRGTWSTWVAGARPLDADLGAPVAERPLRWARSTKVCVALAALGALALAAYFQTPQWEATSYLVRDACAQSVTPAVKSWSLERLRVVENGNWLTWVIVMGVVTLVGVCFSNSAAPASRKGEV
jgi:hypothetical protein